MISQQMPSENIVVLKPNDIIFPQTEKPKPTNPTQDSLVKHLMAEIKVLGTIQITSGLMVLSLGLILVSSPSSPHFTPAYSTLLKSTYPFLGVFFFVTSGSLSIITEKKSIKTLVQSSLATNILSCLSAGVGFILLSISLVALGPASQQCYLDDEPTSEYRSYYYATTECYMATVCVTGLLSVMLIFTLLELCIAVLATLLWWKQAHSDFQGKVIFFPYIDKNKLKTTSDSAYEELLTP